MRSVKQQGFSDRQIAFATKSTEDEVRAYRKSLDIIPVYKMVDTCAAEFEALTPYYYSTYEMENEARKTDTKKIVILGGGTGGTLTANRLHRMLGDSCAITVVDQDDQHVYQPGLLLESMVNVFVFGTLVVMVCGRVSLCKSGL